MMGMQLSFFPYVDEKQIRSIVVQELKKYKALKIQQQNRQELTEKGISGNIFPKLLENDLENELKVIHMERALENSLDHIEMKYLSPERQNDINIYGAWFAKDTILRKEEGCYIHDCFSLGII